MLILPGEDEYLVAGTSGPSHGGRRYAIWTRRVRKTLHLLGQTASDAAILDVSLGNEKSLSGTQSLEAKRSRSAMWMWV
jgi:hypothetical protein